MIAIYRTASAHQNRVQQGNNSDEGYVEAERLLNVVEVKGRGGTRLQPAIDLLEKAEDFPPDAPILVITDGMCDRLKIHRDYAFLLPQGRSLPFNPRGPVFLIR